MLCGKVATSGRGIRFSVWIDGQLLIGACCLHLNNPTSSRRIEIYLAEALYFLVGGLRSTLLETIFIRPVDSILPGCEKFSTSEPKMQFFWGMFQPSGRIIEICITEPGSFLPERLSSTFIKTMIFWPEHSMLPAWEKIPHSGCRMQFLFRKFQLFSWRIWILLAESGSFLLDRLSSTLVETDTSRPED